MPHRLWVHQRLAVVRSAEAGGIDGDEVRGGREVRPSLLESVYAFRPRAHQDRVGTVLAAFGVADRQSVNRDCLRVNQGTHGHSSSGAWQGCQSWTQRSAGAHSISLACVGCEDIARWVVLMDFKLPLGMHRALRLARHIMKIICRT